MQIIVYSTPSCPQCTQTKNLLMFSHLPYHEVEVERDSPEFEQLKAEGVRTFPVVDVLDEQGKRTQRWTGYNVEKVRALLEPEDAVA